MKRPATTTLLAAAIVLTATIGPRAFDLFDQDISFQRDCDDRIHWAEQDAVDAYRHRVAACLWSVANVDDARFCADAF